MSAGYPSNGTSRCELAILTPDLGLPSETFVGRHCNDLLPRRTAAVARTQGRGWQPTGPALLTESLRPPAPSPLQRLGRRLGLDSVTPANGPGARDAFVLEQTQQFLRNHQVSVLMGEYLHWCVRQIPLARSLGLPFWAHGHGFDVSAHLRHERYRREYLQFADIAGLIVVSDFSRRRLIDLGLPAGKVHVIPCGTVVPDEPRQREPDQAVRCLAVGRMVTKKGPIYLLEAFRQALAEAPQLHLDIVGGGELFPAVQQFVQAFNLRRQVTLHGEQPQERVLELLGQADLFLHHAVVDPHTGDEEGLPVAILEAMAHALPVITTRHAGIPEAVVDGECGLLSRECDPAGMAANVVRLARDPALRTAFGHAGWERARLHFSWEREKRDLLGLMGLERAQETRAVAGQSR